MSSGSVNLEVETFAPEGVISVRVCPPCRARLVKGAVGEKLGLRPDSLLLFALFDGPLDTPNSVLAEETVVTDHVRLSFQRWTADLTQETRLCRHDDMAIHLLFCEAQHWLQRQWSQGVRGGVRATAEQLSQLQEFADPTFPVERQFLDLARSLPGYGAMVARGVVMETDLLSNDINLRSGVSVTCVLEREKLVIFSDTGVEFSWQWELVKRWRTQTQSQLQFQVCVRDANAPLLCWLSLRTPQAYYLRAASEMICHNRPNERGSQQSAPAANPSMAGKPFNPLVDFLNSELFRYDRFSSVEK